MYYRRSVCCYCPHTVQLDHGTPHLLYLTCRTCTGTFPCYQTLLYNCARGLTQRTCYYEKYNDMAYIVSQLLCLQTWTRSGWPVCQKLAHDDYCTHTRWFSRHYLHSTPAGFLNSPLPVPFFPKHFKNSPVLQSNTWILWLRSSPITSSPSAVNDAPKGLLSSPLPLPWCPNWHKNSPSLLYIRTRLLLSLSTTAISPSLLTETPTGPTFSPPSGFGSWILSDLNELPRFYVKCL